MSRRSARAVKRTLAPEEAALWKRVIETVKPLKGGVVPPPSPPLPVKGKAGGGSNGGGGSMAPAALAALVERPA